MVADEDLSVVDLWSIASAATLRCRCAWLTPDAANARVVELEDAIAAMKLRLHDAENDARSARYELSVIREFVDAPPVGSPVPSPDALTFWKCAKCEHVLRHNEPAALPAWNYCPWCGTHLIKPPTE